MKTNRKFVFTDLVCSYLSGLHKDYIIVPADKAPNNVIFVCKIYNIKCLINKVIQRIPNKVLESVGITLDG